jgi:hypothetical protein
LHSHTLSRTEHEKDLDKEKVLAFSHFTLFVNIEPIKSVLRKEG